MALKYIYFSNAAFHNKSFYLKLKRVKINDLMEESSGYRQACGLEKRERNSQPSYQSIEFSSSSAVLKCC